MRQDKKRCRKRQSGFTLFEAIVVICVIVFLYMVAAQRLNELPAAAERVNFFSMLEQIKTAINLEMLSMIAEGNTNEVYKLAESNPMELMLETPGTYRGELEEVTDRPIRRGSWYFETSTNELVYVVGERSIKDVFVRIAGYLVNYGQIRFKLVNIYRENADINENNNSTQVKGDDWQGILLEPVNEYSWELRSEAPVKLNEY